MKTKLKIFSATLSLVALLGGLPSTADAAGGASVKRINFDTAFTTVAADVGTLYTVHIPTGTPGDWTVCFDTITQGTNSLSAGEPIWVTVISTFTTGGGMATSAPESTPHPPINLTRGLLCAQSSRGHQTIITYKSP